MSKRKKRVATVARRSLQRAKKRAACLDYLDTVELAPEAERNPKLRPTTGKTLKALAQKGEVEIVGSLVTLRGKTAKRAAKICRDTGVPFKVLMEESMRVFVDLAKSERIGRIEDIHWPEHTAELFKRLDAWKQNRAAKVAKAAKVKKPKVQRGKQAEEML